MRNKKILTLAALGAIILTGCSEIRSRPSDYDDPIIDDTIQDVVNNINSVVYDALDEAGTTNEEVLKRVKVTFAESIFGTLEEIRDALESGADSEAFRTLKDAHAFYTEEVDESLTDAEKNAYSFKRLEWLEAQISERVNKEFYDLIMGGEFSTDSLFDEEELANDIRSQLYTVVDPTTGAYPTTFHNEVLILPSRTEENVTTWGIHLEYYDDYVLRALIPDIFIDLATEQYLFDENYSSLGRSYARKVNYIAITASEEFSNAVPYLMREFIDENILGAEATKETANLEILASAWRGYADDYIGNASELLSASAGAGSFVNKTSRHAIGDSTISYYSGTQYGNVIDDYDLIYEDNPQQTNQEVESDFTGSYAYTASHGLELKTRSVRTTDYTTDGWYIQNGGLTSLPSWIRTRLFNIGVANGVDTVTDEKDASITEENVRTSNFVRNINGYYYLLPATSEAGSDAKDFLLYDNDTSTYYIVQIEEAVSSSKMNRDSQNNYTHLKEDDGWFMEDVAREIAMTMAEGGSYDDQATLFYFEEMNIQYYDEDLYDYFVETFPDLFED